MTLSESTFSKLSDFWIQESLTFGVVPGDGTEVLQGCGGLHIKRGS
jgi:hypothetical protein